ncbi:MULTISPECIES: helix-turn-helix domain-containing protein, partial [Enterobacteriaceae]
EWVHVQLHQQKGMISLSPPTICNSARSITLIAAQVGYESPSALSRAFRRKTGLSPRDWLKDLAGENDGKKA